MERDLYIVLLWRGSDVPPQAIFTSWDRYRAEAEARRAMAPFLGETVTLNTLTLKFLPTSPQSAPGSQDEE
jgi:hypothetical protein